MKSSWTGIRLYGYFTLKSCDDLMQHVRASRLFEICLLTLYPNEINAKLFFDVISIIWVDSLPR